MSKKYFQRLVTDNMKKTGFSRYVCNFSVDYKAIAVDDINYIHVNYIHIV